MGSANRLHPLYSSSPVPHFLFHTYHQRDSRYTIGVLHLSFLLVVAILPAYSSGYRHSAALFPSKPSHWHWHSHYDDCSSLRHAYLDNMALSIFPIISIFVKKLH